MGSRAASRRRRAQAELAAGEAVGDHAHDVGLGDEVRRPALPAGDGGGEAGQQGGEELHQLAAPGIPGEWRAGGEEGLGEGGGDLGVDQGADALAAAAGSGGEDLVIGFGADQVEAVGPQQAGGLPGPAGEVAEAGDERRIVPAAEGVTEVVDPGQHHRVAVRIDHPPAPGALLDVEGAAGRQGAIGAPTPGIEGRERAGRPEAGQGRQGAGIGGAPRLVRAAAQLQRLRPLGALTGEGERFPGPDPPFARGAGLAGGARLGRGAQAHHTAAHLDAGAVALGGHREAGPEHRDAGIGGAQDRRRIRRLRGDLGLDLAMLQVGPRAIAGGQLQRRRAGEMEARAVAQAHVHGGLLRRHDGVAGGEGAAGDRALALVAAFDGHPAVGGLDHGHGIRAQAARGRPVPAQGEGERDGNHHRGGCSHQGGERARARVPAQRAPRRGRGSLGFGDAPLHRGAEWPAGAVRLDARENAAADVGGRAAVPGELAQPAIDRRAGAEMLGRSRRLLEVGEQALALRLVERAVEIGGGEGGEGIVHAGAPGAAGGARRVSMQRRSMARARESAMRWPPACCHRVRRWPGRRARRSSGRGSGPWPGAPGGRGRR